MNREMFMILIPVFFTPIALLGFTINISNGYENEPVIIKSFFPDGEDLHLGTLLIFISIANGITLLIISKVIFPRIKRKENREYRAGHTGTLPKDWGK